MLVQHFLFLRDTFLLAHKLGRNVDMNEDQELLEGDPNHSRSSREHGPASNENEARVVVEMRIISSVVVAQVCSLLSLASANQTSATRSTIRYGKNVISEVQGQLRITVKKSRPLLGMAIEGGANTKHPLPRIINIHEKGAAFQAGGLEVGQLILEVNGVKLEGMQHQEIARLIAESFSRNYEIEFLVLEAKKSNLEPKPTALIFMES
ncbi:hypothetical protein M8J76_013670 [Diaphorina citri]|nr:hypothetical protein M8J76_013670 [Diaphorina citri]